MDALWKAIFKGNQAKQAQREARRAIGFNSSGSFFGIAPLIACALLIWPFGGGKKVQMMAGRETPAAQGVVIVDQGANGNRTLDVKVSSLAQPDSLRPPANVYLVWIQEPGHQPQNLGQIQLNGKEQGELHVKTPFSRFKLFITAEQNAQEHMPEGMQVLSADVPAR